ncbi:MAG TPA: FAD-binding oxidoreductase [Thermoplasmatales archaeon]|nr:FAD-binding oxidoreductase [Thermoplasmatales archaeon]HEX16986.1 FAD-binding oxidoreductase [Thermoplasmatales archaeon]
MRYDVAIVGGGINGCSLAYQLSKRGLRVALFERDYLCSGATGRCGAGIRQQWSTKENIVLAKESVRIFENLSRELGEDIGFRQGGYLIAIHDEDELKSAEERVRLQRSLGVDVRIIDREEMLDIVPILDPDGMQAISATFCPTDGHADPFKTTFAYARSARRYGADIFTHREVRKIIVNNGRVVGLIAGRDEVKADYIVNSAGAWSREVARLAGIKIPNVPVRKEAIVTERIRRVFDAMVISFRDGIYFSQQDEGHILGGIPGPDEREGYHFQPTFSFLVHMARTLTRYAPSLRCVKILRHWTGFYDVSPDARPIIGEDPKVKGFIHCHGFSGHGFMLSPMVTKILAEYIADGKDSDHLHSLSIERFKGKKIRREVSVVG